MSRGSPTGRLRGPVPWVAGYQRSWWRGDALAGAAVWALLVPECLAYATIAGVPPVVGLYAAVPALVAYALLGTSRQLVVGPMSATAALSGSIAAAFGGGTPGGVLTATVVLALMVGVVGIVAGILRLGFLSTFISEPVLRGFIVGLATMIVLGQVPRLLDIDPLEHGAGFFRSVWHVVSRLGEVHWLSATVGLVALVAVIVLRRTAPRVPGALVVVVLGILADHAFGLAEHGVAVVGPITGGLPAPGLPDAGLGEYLRLSGHAAGVLLIGFVEGLAAAKAYATTREHRVDPNRELTALGAANLGSGLFGGMVVNGSLSKTAVNVASGARSQAASLVAASLTLLTLLLLTGPFESLPEPVLAAIVIAAVIELVNPAAIYRLYRVWTAPLGRIYRVAARPDFIAALGALVGVLVFDTLPGLFIGIGLSMLLLLYRSSRPHLARMVRHGDRWLDEGRHDVVAEDDALVVLRVESQLYFANAEYVGDAVRAAAGPDVRAVVLDVGTVPSIDVTAADVLAELQTELEGRGVSLLVAGGVGQFRDVIAAAGQDRLLGALRNSVDDAVRDLGAPPPEPGAAEADPTDEPRT